ncbi:MAG: DUF3500 domain-containing protein [Planctomycetaceae bacterium]|nr:DUF3500 domain-containing protein [Planctomycetaceae bacterium]
MNQPNRRCPDCDAMDHVATPVSRRKFLQTTAAAGVALGALPAWAEAKDKPAGTPESLVKTLYDSLSDDQKSKLCFAWDYMDPKRGLLRTRVANNWNITPVEIDKKGNFTDDQRDLIKAIFEGIIDPSWHARIYKQLDDDAGGFGVDQSFAIFGKPGDGKFEFVMTGRHMTIRCDGNSTEHVAFGGPIFYGHAAAAFNEPKDHAGNVFWHQAVEANKLYTMLDGKQQKQALVTPMPREQDSGFRSKEKIAGIPTTELSADQKAHLQKVLQLLIEPYRQSDRDEVVQCLKTQGGLDACSLAFYSQGDIGNDGVWDNWRIEGPSFVWHYRGAPHVHVWVNVADDASVKLNA